MTLKQPKLQMFGAWSALIYCALFLIGWVGFNGDMFPPHSPSWDQASVVAIFQNNTIRIRLSMVTIMFSAMFLIPFAGALGSQISRIEGGIGLLTISAILGTFSIAMFTFYPPIWWLAISFRPERLGDIIYFMNDAAWLQFIGAISLFIPMILAQGIAAFIDTSEDRVFPRWSGFFCIWVAVLELPVSLIFFFKNGPFAWNGLIGFWLPGTVFFIYFLITFHLIRSFIKRRIKGASSHDKLALI
jgi:hypothetical protein